MKFKNFIFIVLCFSFVFISCKSVRKITSKDNSVSKNIKKNGNRKVEFIEDIEITPGSVVKSKHKPATTKSKVSNIELPTNINSSSKFEFEKVNRVQIKYALLLNTYVENLTNLELYLKLDEWLGTRYCLGGSTKNCIDCSAFAGNIIREIYKINLPRTAHEQFNVIDRKEKDDFKEGDLVFFRTKKGYINHVGIYLWNNKFIHASSSLGVAISDLDEAYWKNKFAGGGKVIN